MAYLAGVHAETFSLDDYLSRLDPRLLATSEGRREISPTTYEEGGSDGPRAGR
jgi:hypothetical protein